jgi:hypothetical protein
MYLFMGLFAIAVILTMVLRKSAPRPQSIGLAAEDRRDG